MIIKPAAALVGFLGATLFLACAPQVQAQDSSDDYLTIQDDLANGLELQEVSDRAYDNAEFYWEYVHGHERDDHDHEPHGPGTPDYGIHDGDDEELSAGEAVTAIYTHAREITGAEHHARDIVRVTIAVIDSWPDCEDTFDAVRAAVELEPRRADEIVSAVAVKRDCNCHNGGIWLDQRVLDRIQVEQRHYILETLVECSCSQIAMYAGIAGLPENREWSDDLPDERKAALSASMTERVAVITERVHAEQTHNSWDCGCTDINIAASMQGIGPDELRETVYEGLEQKYVDHAGDTGLVVDSFGIVGLYPADYWGEGDTRSESNDLRRKPEVYRGDNLILDPFDPSTEFTGHGDRNFENLGAHVYQSPNIPTEVFISEYLEGWGEEALELPEPERDYDEQRCRIIELYNGSEETIDLGGGQYFLEIYGGPGEPRTVVTPPALIKKTISLQSDVTFDFDKADIRAEASEDLQKVIGVLNDADIFSEILISGHTCDMGPDAYNLTLSQRRADSVRDFLRANGLKDVPIRTEGLGEAQPRLPNTSEANRARNRRVDITFVTRDGEEFETTVSQDDAGNDVREYTFMVPIPPTVQDVESERAGGMRDGEYTKRDDDSPRQVVGLSGPVEPGGTWIIAHSGCDEAVRDMADNVTSQLDFRPNETLLLRRLGGDMALNCRAHAWTHVVNYPAVPLIRGQSDEPAPEPPPDDIEFASPN